ncbi:hypothetical protein AKG92_01940 [Klebsiella quasipneumoniae]|nr:hypothetical protein AKG92_01940 [Klebsiella quasipneumoniae]AVR37661.1 hypothetical protein KPC142_02691 [Klebsiella quasipneumoniae]
MTRSAGNTLRARRLTNMAKCRVNGTTARMTKPILTILTMAVSVIRNGNFLGTLMRRAAE